MVLPIAALPFLAIGASAAAAPHVMNYRDKTLGRYRAGALEGVDANDPAATAQALFGAGLLEGADFQRDARTGYESAADRVAAMQRQQLSSGPAYMNAALNREQWEYGVQQDRMMNAGMRAIAEETGMPQVYGGIPSLEKAWVESHAGATFENMNRSTRQVLEDEAAIMNAENAITQGQSAVGNRRALTDAWNREYTGFGMPTLADGSTDWNEVSQMVGGEAARAGAIASTEADTAYRQFAQPLVDNVAEIGWALTNLDDASLDRDFWSTTDGLATRQRINQILMKQRMDYWKNDLGRTDAPGRGGR